MAVALSPNASAARVLDRPAQFADRLDSGLVQVAHPLDGTTWAAWTYRDGATSDVAVAVRGADGSWSEVVRIGEGDRQSQSQPALVIDSATGTAWLAFSEMPSGRVFLAALDGRGQLRAVERVNPPGVVGHSAALRTIAGYVVVAYRTAGGIVLHDRPIVAGPSSIIDGPDPAPGLGDSGKEEDEEDRPEGDTILGGSTSHIGGNDSPIDLTPNSGGDDRQR